jgi:hypothetical protein
MIILEDHDHVARWIASGQPGSPAGPSQYLYSDNASPKCTSTLHLCWSSLRGRTPSGIKEEQVHHQAARARAVLGSALYLGIYKKAAFCSLIFSLCPATTSRDMLNRYPPIPTRVMKRLERGEGGSTMGL